MAARSLTVVVTGAGGFIGSNVVAQLSVREGFTVVPLGRAATDAEMTTAISKADFICHLAGVNRPGNDADFAEVNTGLTQMLADIAARSGRKIPIIFASSVHVERANAGNTNAPSPAHVAYGASKLAAEKVLERYSKATGAPIYICRFSHVVGKWCRPNYNSVVATFCHNIARDLPIQIADPAYPLKIVYIDDVVDTFARIMTGELKCGARCEVEPSYAITVGELADQLHAFRVARETGVTEPVGNGLTRALWSTYLSYLPPSDFAYGLTLRSDHRGAFAEVLKTKDSGQFSFFTAHPGVTRGGHYHHSKTEKFLVVKGTARFRFRHILSGERHELVTSAANPQVVETIPGWSHDITNIGEEEVIVMLWANEIFDPARPDTYASAL
jgi:UDP-2-acetamido-2,6-beta-L-arabino-hexul-4-ose reductase